MRTKKQAFKENLNFYHTFLHLNPPFPILIDGTFILSIIANDVDDFGEYLKDHCGSTFVLFTTKCEQNRLESSYPNDYQINAIMEQIQVYEGPTPHSCFNANSICTSVAEIGKKNLLKREYGPPKLNHYVRSSDPRFIIAMQNGETLKELREIPGVPLMYFDGGHLHLERPSNATLEWASDMKFRSMELLELEREILQRALEADDVIPSKHPEELATEEYQKKKRTKGKGNESSRRTSKAEVKGDKSNEETKRSRRDLSPDICAVPGPSKGSQPGSKGVKSKRMKKFEVYRTLFWDFNQAATTSASTGLQGAGGSQKVNRFSFADPTDLLTDSSTFEFGSEAEAASDPDRN